MRKKKFFFSIPHHSFCHHFCVSLNICTLYHRLTVRLHKTSPCHLYKHRTGACQDGSHQMIALQVGIFASGRALKVSLGYPRDILWLHFAHECPKHGENHFNVAKCKTCKVQIIESFRNQEWEQRQAQVCLRDQSLHALSVTHNTGRKFCKKVIFKRMRFTKVSVVLPTHQKSKNH